MTPPARKRQCRHCKDFFHPDHRNSGRQLSCSQPECRQVSKTESQRRWLQKPDNLDHFKGDSHVQRVQPWRLDHPGSWRRKAPEAPTAPEAFQETFMPPSLDNQEVEHSLAQSGNRAFQETFFMQPTIVVGLIAHLTGLAFQEDIARTARRLQPLGRDMLSGSSPHTGGLSEAPTPALAQPTPSRAHPVQLGGAALGP
jgi:hypothetical protein